MRYTDHNSGGSRTKQASALAEALKRAGFGRSKEKILEERINRNRPIPGAKAEKEAPTKRLPKREEKSEEEGLAAWMAAGALKNDIPIEGMLFFLEEESLEEKKEARRRARARRTAGEKARASIGLTRAQKALVKAQKALTRTVEETAAWDNHTAANKRIRQAAKACLLAKARKDELQTRLVD